MPGVPNAGSAHGPVHAASAIGRRVEPGRPRVLVGHPQRHREARRREIERLGEGRRHAPTLLRGDVRHVPRLRWRNEVLVNLDGPVPAAVAAAREQVTLRLRAVDRMPFGIAELQLTVAEADSDLVAPDPHAVVRRPAAVVTRLPPDLDVLEAVDGQRQWARRRRRRRCRLLAVQLRGQCRCGQGRGGMGKE